MPGCAALRRPTGVQKVGLCAVYSAFDEPQRKAAGNTGGPRHCFGIEAQNLRRKIRRAECGEQPVG